MNFSPEFASTLGVADIQFFLGYWCLSSEETENLNERLYQLICVEETTLPGQNDLPEPNYQENHTGQNAILSQEEFSQDGLHYDMDQGTGEMIGGGIEIPDGILQDTNQEVDELHSEWSDDDDYETPLKRQREETPEDFYKVVSVKQKQIKKFQACTYDYEVKFANLNDLTLREALPRLGSVLQSLIDRLCEGVDPHDMVRMIFHSPDLDFPISLPFLKMNDLTVERFLSRLEAVLQSYQTIRFDQSAMIHFVHLKMTKGGKHTRENKKLLKLKEFLLSKQSIVQINDHGTQTCCARAIVTGIAIHEKHPDEKYIRKSRIQQEVLANQLHIKAGMRKGPCGIEEIQKF